MGCGVGKEHGIVVSWDGKGLMELVQGKYQELHLGNVRFAVVVRGQGEMLYRQLVIQGWSSVERSRARDMWIISILVSLKLWNDTVYDSLYSWIFFSLLSFQSSLRLTSYGIWIYVWWSHRMTFPFSLFSVAYSLLLLYKAIWGVNQTLPGPKTSFAICVFRP